MLYEILRNIFLAFLFVAPNTEALRHYKKVFDRRSSNADAFLDSLSADQSRCAVACLQTVNCDSFNYHHSSSSVSLNCELLMTSATGYDLLTPAADWSIYSSLLLAAPGEAWLAVHDFDVNFMYEHKFTVYCMSLAMSCSYHDKV